MYHGMADAHIGIACLQVPDVLPGSLQHVNTEEMGRGELQSAPTPYADNSSLHTIRGTTSSSRCILRCCC